MNVIFLCKRYYTNQDLIKNKFGRYYHLPVLLKKQGVNVSVFAGNYRENEKESFIIDDVDIISYPLKLLSLIQFIKIFYNKVIENKIDVIICGGDSHFGFIGMIVAKLANIPYVFDVYDHYPVFPSNKIPGMKLMYRMAIKNAAAVICVSENLQRFIEKYNSTVTRIENGVDPSVFHSMDKLECRHNLGITENENVIGYFGSMERMRGIDNLIEACRLLVDEHGYELRLLLSGKKNDNINLQYDWIDYRGISSQEEVARMINACSVVVLPYREDPQIYYSNSCKLAEYFNCRVPIVSTNVDDFVTNYPAEAAELRDAICESDNPISMSKAIINQLLNQKVVIPKNMLSWDGLTVKLQDLLNKIVN